MLKNLVLIIFCLICSQSVFAIEWVTVEAPNGSNALLDLDSIREYKKYYLYNIKVLNKHTNENVVITMQSNSKNGLTSRIKYYSVQKYNDLNGDYENMTNNITRSFEPMQFGSVAHSCYLKVKSIIESNKIQISF